MDTFVLPCSRSPSPSTLAGTSEKLTRMPLEFVSRDNRERAKGTILSPSRYGRNSFPLGNPSKKALCSASWDFDRQPPDSAFAVARSRTVRNRSWRNVTWRDGITRQGDIQKRRSPQTVPDMPRRMAGTQDDCSLTTLIDRISGRLPSQNQAAEGPPWPRAAAIGSYPAGTDRNRAATRLQPTDEHVGCKTEFSNGCRNSLLQRTLLKCERQDLNLHGFPHWILV